MSFWDDLGDFGEGFATGLKDAGTGATRIITDTAIDIGDVTTGFQFSDEMNAAKKAMSEAGILSAADSIQKNHYPEIKRMESKSKSKISQLGEIVQQGKSLELTLVADIEFLAGMCADVSNLAAESEEADELMKRAQNIPDWPRWKKILDIPQNDLITVKEVGGATNKWEQVGRDLSTAGLVTGASNGMASLVALGSISKAKKLSNSVKLGRLGARSGARVGSKATKILAKSAKFMKIGKIAGRASAALAVITIAMDIGMSIVELETKKSDLEKTLKDLKKGIRDANRVIAEIKAEREDVLKQINRLLRSVSPAQSRSSWDGWVETTRASLRSAISELLSVEGIIARAEHKATQTRGRPLLDRINAVVAIDPDISQSEAKEIIVRMDKSVGIVDTITLADASKNRFSDLKWHCDSADENTVDTDSALDMVSLIYNYPAGANAGSWTFYATAPWTRAFQINWGYRASHVDRAANVAFFADQKGVRQFTTLHNDSPQGIGHHMKGKTTVKVEKGQLFGLTVNTQAGASTELQKICGTYTHHPIENDWHTGVIGLKDETGTVLEWRNRAGASWDLLPHLASDRLLKTAGSPYQNAYPGSNEFILQRKGGKITGFEFMAGTYTRMSPAKTGPKKAAAMGFGNITLEFIV